MSLKGVIFDMDGVLCDSEPFICEAAVRMFAEQHATTVQPVDFEPFVGAGEDRYLGGVAEKHGVALRMPENKTRTYDIYLELIKGRLGPLAGVHTFIEERARHGIRMAVATSADEMKMHGNLTAIELADGAFDALVFGELVERKKPFPDIFLMAAERLDLDPSECLVIEDAPNGVQAAVIAGSVCLGITSSFPEARLRECGAMWTAPDLAHVPADLLSLL